MKSFDLTNVNELNASSLELKITGNTNSLIINVDDDSQAKLLFLDANIENITINAGEDSLVILNFIHFNEHTSKQTINASFGSKVVVKEIASNKIMLDSVFNLNGEHATIDVSSLIVAKGFNSNLVQNAYHNAINSNSNIENYGISFYITKKNINTIILNL